MYLLGLTGDIACGKSTVARRLAEHGAEVLDADLLVRELYHDAGFARRVVELFRSEFEQSGQSVASLTHVDGRLNREALGHLVFADARLLRRLEALVHPAVADLRARKLRDLESTLGAASQSTLVVVEAVKLIESGQAQGCDVVWCVTCSHDVQMQRLMQQRGLSESAARARLARQPGLERKRAMLGDVPMTLIENNGSLDELQRRVDAAWRELPLHGVRQQPATASTKNGQ